MKLGLYREKPMFANMGIGSRLISLVLIVNIAILMMIAVVGTASSNTNLRTQVIEQLDNKTNTTAERINNELTTFYETTLKLANDLATVDINNSIELRNFVADYLLEFDEQRLIQQVNIYRSRDESVGVFNLDNPFVANLYQWRVVRLEQEIPFDDERIFAILDDEAPRWFRQEQAYFDATDQTVISLATSHYDNEGNLNGVVWVDVPLVRFETLINDLIGDESLLLNTLRGYELVLDDFNDVIVTTNLPTLLNDDIDTSLEAIFNAIEDPITRNDTIIEINDPLLNIQSIVSEHSIPLFDWKLINILPADEIITLPTDIFVPISLTAFVGLMLLMYLLNRVINDVIVERISDLGRAAQEIGSGDMRYIINHGDSADEIGTLARALDDMKQNISHSYNELSRWSRKLERRVNERTSELQIAREDAIKREGELRAVYDETLLVVNETDLQRILDAVTERILPLLNATYAAIWLRDINQKRLQLVSSNHPQHKNETYLITVNQGIAGEAVRTRQSVLVDNYEDYDDRVQLEGFRRGAPFVRAIGVPLLFAGQAIGTIVIGRGASANVFSDDEARILTLFANIISPTVRNAQLAVIANEATSEAERANDVKTRFLASVTHELRTPLNLIINNMDFMRIGAFGDVTEEQGNRLDQTIRSSEHLLYLINDLLDVSKIEAGEMQLFMQNNDVYTMLEDSLDSAHALLEKMPEKKDKVVITTNITKDLPPLPMDVRRIRQVLTNLLSNALKFTDNGTVDLTVQLEGDGIGFSVTDTGIGIPESEIEKLFTAFERTNDAKSRQIEGTGLGLPISQFLVQQHGGEINVISKVDKGTTFEFTLPFIQGKATDSASITLSQIRAMTRSEIFKASQNAPDKVDT